MFSVSDIIPLITNNLDIKSICSFIRSCKEANSFDWKSYFLFHTNIADEYKEYQIDNNFMKTHGQYLINVTNEDIVKQWFTCYSSIENIIFIYDSFIKGDIYKHKGKKYNFSRCEWINIKIIYKKYYSDITYNKEKNTLYVKNVIGNVFEYRTNDINVFSDNIKSTLFILNISKIIVTVDHNTVYKFSAIDNI